MKKIFTLAIMSVLALVAQAQITIYVQCETAPYIWMWGAANGVDYNNDEDWPGKNQLTQTYTHPDTGETFWTWTFDADAVPISFLFNDGGASGGTKQTKNFNSVNTDRYFILSWDDGNGNVVCEDVTEEYGVEIPDAEVTSLLLVGNHNNWGNEGGVPDQFGVVEAGKVFELTMDMTDKVKNNEISENLWQFKFRPNGQEWIGWWEFYYTDTPEEGKAPSTECPAWLAEKETNFLVDLEATTERVFTFTATWNGGKEAGKNWTLNAVAGASGVTSLIANVNETAPAYNLAGQRVDNGFRGIAIRNGRKMLMK